MLCAITTPATKDRSPECFATLRRLLEARLKHGGREYVQVLRLLETFSLVELTRAIDDALQLGAIRFDAVRHLLLCRIERRPPRLDMENYPHLPLAQVCTTQATDSMALPMEVGAGMTHQWRQRHTLQTRRKFLLEHHLKELRLPTILREPGSPATGLRRWGGSTTAWHDSAPSSR